MYNEMDVKKFLTDNPDVNFTPKDYMSLVGKYLHFKEVSIRFGVIDVQGYPKTVFIGIVFKQNFNTLIKYEFEYENFINTFKMTEIDNEMLETLVAHNTYELRENLIADGKRMSKKNTKKSRVTICRTDISAPDKDVKLERPFKEHHSFTCY